MAGHNVTSLINLFFLTNRSLHKHMQKAAVISTFSFLQYFAMKIVEDEGPLSMKDVARFLSITPASTTSLINGLVTMKALERIADSSDRRIVRLRTTRSGKKKLKDAEQAAKKELKSIFLRLTDRDRNSMIVVLKKLSVILSNDASSTSIKRSTAMSERG